MPSAPDLRSDETKYNDYRVHRAVASERERCVRIANLYAVHHPHMAAAIKEITDAMSNPENE